MGPIDRSIRLLGFRTGRVGPLKSNAITLGSRLTTIYGLNGAGKSSALKALAATLTGRIDLSHTACDLGGTHLIVECNAESPELPALLGLRSLVSLDSTKLSSVVVRRWPDLPGEVLRELCIRPIVALFPCGHGVGQWDAWLAFDPDTHPATARLHRELSEVWGDQAESITELEELIARSDDVRDAVEGMFADIGPIHLADTVGPVHTYNRAYLDAFWRAGDPPYTKANCLWEPSDDSLPRPLFRIGPTAGLRLSVLLEDAVDVSALTAEWARRRALADREAHGLGAEFDPTDDSEEFFEFEHLHAPWLHDSSELEHAEAVTEQVNATYRSLLQAAPELKLVVGSYVDWLAGQPYVWLADGRPLATLSRAQLRWAQLAIALTLNPDYSLLLLDEPESSLHRSAEDHMVSGLLNLALRGLPIVAATHAPDLLDQADSAVLECRRDQNGSVIKPLTEGIRERLEDLGLAPSDLLGGLRTVILVEGLHDQVILEAAIGDRLRRAKARIYAARGAKKMGSILEGPFLVEWTNATIIPVLDSDATIDLHYIIDAAPVVAATSGIAAARTWVLNNFADSSTDKSAYLSELVMSTVEHPRSGHISPYVMSKKDILEYVDPEALGISPGQTWQDLRLAADKAGMKNEMQFKRWLKQKRGASLDEVTLARAGRQLAATLPEEFLRLARLVEDSVRHLSH